MLPRIVSAAVGLPILFYAVWVGPPWLSAAVFIVAIVATFEMWRLAKRWGEEFHIGPPLILTAFMILDAHGRAIGRSDDSGLSRWLAGWLEHPELIIVTIPSYLAAFRLMVGLERIGPPPMFFIGVAASLYAGGLIRHGLLLYGLDQGREWVFFALIVVFATDTSAYLVGRAVGKTPLAPRISPGKTLEGAAAGLLGAMTASGTAILMLGLEVIMWQALVLGALVGVFAQVGDLVESRMKRRAGVKDSGWLIPGHGGILDRMDSIVFAMPAVYYFVIWVIQ